jgi:hypothetical protein
MATGLQPLSYGVDVLWYVWIVVSALYLLGENVANWNHRFCRYFMLLGCRCYRVSFRKKTHLGGIRSTLWMDL